MIGYPKLSTPILLLLLAVLCFVLAWRPPFVWMQADAVRFTLVIVGIVIALFGILTAGDWLVYRYALARREIGEAMAAPAVMVAHALQGLSQAQTEVVAQYGRVGVVGILGEEQVAWMIRCPGGDVSWEFMADFIAKSAERSDGCLHPIREHDVFSGEHRYSERLCTQATNLFIQRQWAEGGPGSLARLLVPISEVARVFRVTLEED